MRYGYRILLLLLSVTVAPQEYFCRQYGFASVLLQDLSRAIPPSVFPEVFPVDTVVSYVGIVGDVSVPVHIRRDTKGIITHLGYHLVETGSDDMFSEYSVMFAERLLLQMLVSDNSGSLLDMYDSKGVSITVDGLRLLPGQCIDRLSVYEWVSDCNKLAATRYGTYCELNLSGTSSIQILFPLSYELMYGMNKKELDLYMAQCLAGHHVVSADTAVSAYIDSCVTEYNDSVRHLNGDYYMIPEINDCVTVVEKDSSVRAVFTPSMLPESFRNIMLNVTDVDFTFEIAHSVFGRTFNYISSSDAFFSFFGNCDLYYGTTNVKDSSVSGVLILKDRYSDCAHMAVVSASERDLFETHVVKMSLLTNIPQNEIMQ